MSQLVLSLFPGIGLLDMAFEEAGYCVVRGPDLLWGGAIETFHPPGGRFDGVIGGPPCQFASAMRHVNAHKPVAPAVDKIPEFERVVREASPAWFLMENVRDAPLPLVEGYHTSAELIRHHWVGGETMRLRRFTLGTRDGRRLQIETLALCRPDPEPAALASGGNVPGTPRRHRHFLGNMGYKTAAVFVDHCRLQGLPEGFDLPPFTVAAKIRAVGNGVPLEMGRAVAAAVRKATA